MHLRTLAQAIPSSFTIQACILFQKTPLHTKYIPVCYLLIVSSAFPQPAPPDSAYRLLFFERRLAIPGTPTATLALCPLCINRTIGPGRVRGVRRYPPSTAHSRPCTLPICSSIRRRLLQQCREGNRGCCKRVKEMVSWRPMLHGWVEMCAIEEPLYTCISSFSRMEI